MLGAGLPVEGRRALGRGKVEQVIAHDHERQARRTDVLLRAGEDHAIFRNVDLARQDVRRHVGHDRQIGRHVGRVRVFDAVDGLVGADVQIRGVVAQAPGVARRDTGEVLRLARGRDVHACKARRFLGRLARPGAGVDEVDHRVWAATGQVEGHDGVLPEPPTLLEQDLVIGRHVQQLAQINHRLAVDAGKFGTTVAHLHHRHAAAMPVEHVVRGLLEHLFRQYGGAGREIEDLGHAVLSWRVICLVRSA